MAIRAPDGAKKKGLCLPDWFVNNENQNMNISNPKKSTFVGYHGAAFR